MNPSIVIPTIDGREESLARTIQIYRETMPAAEVIIEHGHPTVADAWNAGALRATGDTLHLTADDLTPETGWWEAASETLACHALPAPVFCHPTGGESLPPPGGVQYPGHRDWSAFHASVIPTLPTSLWREIAPLPSIHYYSDNLISARAFRHGWPSALRAPYRFIHYLHDVGRAAKMAGWADDEAVFRQEVSTYCAVTPMRVLITGACGFIGSYLTSELVNTGHRVACIDRHDGDLSDPGVITEAIQKHRPDVVVHLAASPGRVFGEDDLGRTIAQNATIAANVASACAAVGVRLVYASTSEAYGIRDDGYEAESAGYSALPHNLYGLSKRWGEEVSALYSPVGLQVLRISMPYGPGLPAGRGRNALHNFIWWASHGERLRVHSGAARSWCWIGDTARAIRQIIEAGERAMDTDDIRAGRGVYNVGRDDADRKSVV
jgi:nucleoside-diphosphate-sugar epimerase